MFYCMWRIWRHTCIFNGMHVHVHLQLNRSGRRKNISTEGCSKLKSQEKSSQEKQDKFRMRLVSSLEHLQVLKWDRTRGVSVLCWHTSPVAKLMFYGNLSQLGKKSISVIRFRSVIGSKNGVMPDQSRVSL